MTMVTVLACRFEHASAYKGINMSMTSKAFLVGGGIGSMAAAFMIGDGKLPGANITILEASPVLGGSLDGAGDAESGYSLRGGRMLTTDNYECTWASFTVTLKDTAFFDQIQ